MKNKRIVPFLLALGLVPGVAFATTYQFRSYEPGVVAPLAACSLPWGGQLGSGQSVTAYNTANATDCAAVGQTRTCTNGTLSGSYAQPSCLTACTLPWGGVLDSGQSVTAYSASSATNCSADTQTRTCTNGSLSGSYGYQACSTIATCPTTPYVYAYTGTGVQQLAVPAGCTTMNAEVWGAGGGGYYGTALGGAGGYTLLTNYPITAGTMLYIAAGQGGAGICSGQCSNVGLSGAAWGNGGQGYQSDGGGGGSYIATDSTFTANAMLAVAGGGGGGGAGTGGNGGAGGGTAGANGSNPSGAAPAYGGTQTTGGVGAYTDLGASVAGSYLQGGSIASATADYGGGGGGGYYGGGTGGREGFWEHSGGAGGSGFVISGYGSTQAGSGATPVGTGSTNYQSGVAVGGGVTSSANNGGNGLVVIWFQ